MKGPGPLPALEMSVPGPVGTSNNRPALILHICSGPHRVGYVSEHAASFGRDMGVEVLVVAFDPVIDGIKNLLGDKQFSDMCDLADCEDAFGALGGPPCSTFSRIRHGWVPSGPDLCDLVITRLSFCLG